MASPTQWTWVWVGFGRWWWTGKLGVLQSMGSQWVGHDWETELTEWPSKCSTWVEYLSKQGIIFSVKNYVPIITNHSEKSLPK